MVVDRYLEKILRDLQEKQNEPSVYMLGKVEAPTPGALHASTANGRFHACAMSSTYPVENLPGFSTRPHHAMQVVAALCLFLAKVGRLTRQHHIKPGKTRIVLTLRPRLNQFVRKFGQFTLKRVFLTFE